MTLRVAFRTLGCKLNQLETESLADSFRRSGARVVGFEEEAELYVVNTCTVTGKAEQKARRVIRQALARRPGAVAVATGCYAQMDPAGLGALDERLVVVPGEEKAAIISLAAYLGEEWQGHGELLAAVLDWRRAAAPRGAEAACADRDRFAFFPEEFAFHSRPALKVQDGCDNRCAYCRVCLARGTSTSLPAAQALERLRSLEEAGRAEAVLTGVNLSQYRDGELDFPGLLRLLLAGTSRIALRLSSYEPERVDAAFLEVFAERRIRPHVHLPVQSGSDAVLGRMGRSYRRDRVLAAVSALRSVRGEPFLAADFIAGFPGESEADHEASAELARACRFAWIHAFPFSARPGTRAWDMKPRVPERVAGERVAELAAIGREGRNAYLGGWIGRELDAVLEGPPGDPRSPDGSGGSRPARRPATSENYLKLGVRGIPGDWRPGRALRCLVEGLPGVEELALPPDSEDIDSIGVFDLFARSGH